MNLDPDLITKLLAIKMPDRARCEVLAVLAGHEPSVTPAALRKRRQRDKERDMSHPESVTCHATVTEQVTPLPPSPLPSPTPPPHAPTPAPPPEAGAGAKWRIMTQAAQREWLERIAAAYGKSGNPLNVLPLIRRSIETNNVDPLHIFTQTSKASEVIRKSAPNGFASALVPHAETFFEKETWREPEALAGYWAKSRQNPVVNGGFSTTKALEGLTTKQILGED